VDRSEAHLAQALVRRAWRETLAGARDTRPWPWADTRPVARLLVPGQGVETFVLAGASVAPWLSARGTWTGPHGPASAATR